MPRPGVCTRSVAKWSIRGTDINPDPTTDWHECMRRDLAALLTWDALALFDGWQQSTGVHLEAHAAHRVGMPVVSAKEVTHG
ncbi:DUF4406 domain-containing protein [Verminephrobacter eiseniae]|nr:DUF4406 domain-containing protein [Verminephrobacter eiseniae]